ncbi:MAG: hypothetical protein M3Z20_03625 [Chloroflexota bacterium]|nr:hypothetical protein [Chloroflexota bacterium]
MPGRFAGRSPQPEGPKPFSAEWVAAHEQPPSLVVATLPPRTGFRLPGWFPGERATSAGLLVVVILLTVYLTLPAGRGGPLMHYGGPTAEELAVQSLAAQATLVPDATLASIEAMAPQAQPSVAQVTQPTVAPAAVPTTVPVVAPTTAPTAAAAPAAMATTPPTSRTPFTEALLPEYRIVAYYGHPHDSNMGIVGEMPLDELTGKLHKQAEAFEAADPSRPVVPALELIATVAQRDPGFDGTYILDTDHETLREYIDYAAEHDMLVILDVQIGRGTVADEIEKVRDLLEQPNVHLALDPEFAIAEGETPGDHIGSLDADTITYAQQVLAEISTEQGIPPKMLIVHQFREDMISGKGQLAPMPGVQLVIDADGFGEPELKTFVYNYLVRDEPVEFGGIKLFYSQDSPLMKPREILDLVPAPDVIIYQ